LKVELLGLFAIIRGETEVLSHFYLVLQTGKLHKCCFIFYAPLYLHTFGGNTCFSSNLLSLTFAVLTPGVDVMITIFCDFCQFSAKKLAFFSKTNVMKTISAKTSSSLSKKRQYFC
jgi:hypothetical protein